MTDTVWSVNILLTIGLVGVAYVIYYILALDYNESNHSRDSNTGKTHNE